MWLLARLLARPTLCAVSVGAVVCGLRGLTANPSRSEPCRYADPPTACAPGPGLRIPRNPTTRRRANRMARTRRPSAIRRRSRAKSRARRTYGLRPFFQRLHSLIHVPRHGRRPGPLRRPHGLAALGSLDLLGGSSELARPRRPPGPLNLTVRAPGIARRALMYELQNARHFYRQFHAAAPRL